MNRAIVLLITFFIMATALVAKKNQRFDVYSNEYIERPYRSETNLKDIELGDRKIGTVHFTTGSHVLSPPAISQVAEIANILINDWADPNLFSRNYRLKVIGFADAQGGAKFNMQLGILRAEAVANMLEKLRVPMQGAVVASHGKTQAYYKSPKFRRAEVWLEAVDQYSNRILIYAVVFFVIIIFLGGGFYLVVINSGRRIM